MIEIVTNGDPLKPQILREIYRSRTTKLIIVMYDGEHQIDYFESMIAGKNRQRFCCLKRNRWHMKLRTSV